MKIKTILSRSFAILSIIQLSPNIIAQENSLTGTTNPFADAIEDKTDKLLNKPRLGMTEEELIQRWGTPKTRRAYLISNPMNGMKTQHKNYIYRYPFASEFHVGALRLNVWFYKGKAQGIMISKGNTEQKLTTETLKKLAESLCKMKFSELPDNIEDNYAVYSTDEEESYILQYQGERCVIIHLPSWTQFRTEEEQNKIKKSEIQINEILKGL